MKTWKNIALALSLALGTFALAPSAFACDCNKEEGKECKCKDCGKEGHACKHGKGHGKHKAEGGDEAKKEAPPAK